MRNGQLRWPISIVERQFIADEAGAGDLIDATVAEAAASIEQYSGTEVWQGQQLEGRELFTISLRYQPGIRADQQVLWGERRLRIRRVQNVKQRNRELILTCEELASGVA